MRRRGGLLWDGRGERRGRFELGQVVDPGHHVELSQLALGSSGSVLTPPGLQMPARFELGFCSFIEQCRGMKPLTSEWRESVVSWSWGATTC